MKFENFKNITTEIIMSIYEEEYEKMPAKITKIGSKYKVLTPSGVHAKGTTKAKAVKQARLLNAIDHGFKPKRKK